MALSDSVPPGSSPALLPPESSRHKTPESGPPSQSPVPDVDSTSAQALFALYAAENGAAQTAAQDLSGYQVPLLKLFKFLNDKIADGTVTLSAAQAAQVTALSSQLERASAQLEGHSCRSARKNSAKC